MSKIQDEALGLNYRIFLDTLVEINESSEVQTNITAFMKRDYMIRRFKKDNYKRIKSLIAKHNAVCLTKSELNKVMTLEGQIEVLESKDYHELIKKLILCSISSDSTKRREFNIDIRFAVCEHFIKLSNRLQK